MLNRCIVMGRLGKDPEKRYTQSNTTVASFTLAVERDFRDKQSGERVTDWLDVVAWRQTAEFVCKHFSKGRMAIVEGRLQNRTYTDREGNQRKVVEIVADNVYFGDSRLATAAPSSHGNADERMFPSQESGSYTELEEEGELPF
ncbi:MAG: single-stranded DNA-binding protein [Lawsonibacter sp.]|jgi:single-strand DNA-binding protein